MERIKQFPPKWNKHNQRQFPGILILHRNLKTLNYFKKVQIYINWTKKNQRVEGVWAIGPEMGKSKGSSLFYGRGVGVDRRVSELWGTCWTRTLVIYTPCVEGVRPVPWPCVCRFLRFHPFSSPYVFIYNMELIPSSYNKAHRRYEAYGSVLIKIPENELYYYYYYCYYRVVVLCDCFTSILIVYCFDLMEFAQGFVTEHPVVRHLMIYFINLFKLFVPYKSFCCKYRAFQW